jgi:hypothetical protein
MEQSNRPGPGRCGAGLKLAELFERRNEWPARRFSLASLNQREDVGKRVEGNNSLMIYEVHYGPFLAILRVGSQTGLRAASDSWDKACRRPRISQSSFDCPPRLGSELDCVQKSLF